MSEQQSMEITIDARELTKSMGRHRRDRPLRTRGKTRLETLKGQYVNGEIDLEEFESELEQVL